jgi:hypothetical protein
MKALTSFARSHKANKFGLWISNLVSLTLCGFSLFGCGPNSLIPQDPMPTLSLLPTPTAQPMDNLEDLVRELRKTMPKANTEGFIIPTKSDQQGFQDMVNAIENSDPDRAAKLATAYNYELLMLSDQKDFGAESYILHEELPIRKGWGLYFFRKVSSQNIVIEAPHPVADEDTEEVALGLYRALQAKALLISGTHRDANADGSADSTHAPKTIFQTTHTTLFQLAGQTSKETIFLQIHGYARRGHRSYPQVVMSFNWKNDPEKDLLLTRIVRALQNNDVTVGICNGKNYQDVCGTTNVQRLATNGGIFIHLELSESLREHDNAFITALKQALTP